MTEAEYERAKRAYHAAGRAAKDQAPNSAARKAYEKATRVYHKAGEALRNQNARK
jgi:hypothetical protein